MTSLLTKRLRLLCWFLAGVVCTALFSFSILHVQQAVTAAVPNQNVNRSVVVQPSKQLQPIRTASHKASGFDAVAASHLEPNFYN